MSPPRSEPGRTRWVPCGPARLPTRRARLGLPRFGCWFYIGVRSHEQGRAPRQSSQAASAARAKLQRIVCTPVRPSTLGKRRASPRTRGPARADRGRRPSSARSSRRRSTKIFAPHGRPGGRRPSVFGSSSVPHPEACPASGRVRTPASAGYQPLSLETAGWGSRDADADGSSLRAATASATTTARRAAAPRASSR